MRRWGLTTNLLDSDLTRLSVMSANQEQAYEQNTEDEEANRDANTEWPIDCLVSIEVLSHGVCGCAATNDPNSATPGR